MGTQPKERKTQGPDEGPMEKRCPIFGSDEAALGRRNGTHSIPDARIPKEPAKEGDISLLDEDIHTLSTILLDKILDIATTF